MTDRLREEAIKDALVTLLIFRSHATAAQRIHERPGPRDVGPGFLEKPEASRYATVRDEFRHDLYASIQLSMAQHHIDYIPGAAELGDFDATSTTIAVTPADELGRLPQPSSQTYTSRCSFATAGTIV